VRRLAQRLQILQAKLLSRLVEIFLGVRLILNASWQAKNARVSNSGKKFPIFPATLIRPAISDTLTPLMVVEF
jgi:hypothetical protein